MNVGDLKDLKIEALKLDARSINRFMKVSYVIYDSDPNWVAPLLMDLQKVFTSANPLFEHAEMQLWIVTRGGRDVGRIAGILDRTYLHKTGRSAAFFGFFECLEDVEASRMLFRAVNDWAKAKGVQEVLGPMNPTTNDECGLLVRGYDSPPVLMMTYNPSYYVRLVEEEGYRPAKNLLAFKIDLAGIPLDRLARIAEKLKKRNPTLRLRPITKKSLSADLPKVKEVYNSAWEDNWGFVPMTDTEMDFMAERMKPLLMEGLIWLVEDGTEPVGFLLALPDYNVPLQPMKGRLLTPAIFGFAAHLLGWKKFKRARVITLGVKREYRNRGLESAMLIEGLKVGFAAGLTEAEASWILEDNQSMVRVIEAIGGVAYKEYRIYEKPVSS